MDSISKYAQKVEFDDDDQFQVDRLKALLKNDYHNYRWLDKQMKRKKTLKNPQRLLKLKRRQDNLSQIIDKREEVLEEMTGR